MSKQSASLTIIKSDLIAALRQLKIFAKKGNLKNFTVEFTVIDDWCVLVVPGAELKIKAITNGTVKFTLRLLYFYDIIINEPNNEIFIEVSELTLKIRGLTFGALTTFFQNDQILRSINIPSNYSYIDLANLYLSEKFTKEEIEFNNLTKETKDAYTRVIKDINLICVKLHKYGFKRKEIEEMIKDRINS